MIKEKIDQAFDILREDNIDCWLTFVRESSTTYDPAMDLIVGTGITWHSAFILTAKKESIAIVGSLDQANKQDHGYYGQIKGYVESIEKELIATLNKIKPNKIAINYSLNSPTCDGLTHGMFLQLKKYLQNTSYVDRLISSESIINKLRGRKSQTEKERVKQAIDLTIKMFKNVWNYMKVGRSEKEVADFLIDLVKKEGVNLAWDPQHCPAVFTGPDTAGAHAGPTNRRIEYGHVLNIDFGVMKDNYCSDLQRTWYFLRPGEKEAPPEVKRGFQIIYDSISAAAKALKPGKKGYEIDNIARAYITDHGYKEYPHALGHQIGREAHDGGGLLGPKWDRYGNLPNQSIEKNQLYTLEPRLIIEDYGIATIEEIVTVTENGCEFLSPRQKDIYLVHP
jgi:Xaa-Pro aminopeptidase